MAKGKTKSKTKGEGTNKSKPKSDSISVPLYPFDDERTEKVTLSETELILVNDCLAPRIRACVLVRADVTYRFSAGDSDMSRFKRLVRRFLIDKGILTWDEAARNTFFELVGMLTREVEREENRINSEWTEGLRDMWQTALEHKEHWQAKAWRLIELLKQSGEDVTQALLPHIANEGSAWEGFRGPTPSDSPWMCWILGSVLGIVFGVNDVLIPREAAKELSSRFGTFDRAINEEIWWHCSLEDCRTYWSFVGLDLNADDKQENDENVNEVPWVKDLPEGWITNAEAVKQAYKKGNEEDINELQCLDLPRLNKFLRKPGCSVRFMSTRKPRPRGGVHSEDWSRYLKTIIEQSKLVQDQVDLEMNRRLR